MIRPMERTGNSANIVFYQERHKLRESYVWCEVLHSVPFARDHEGLLRIDRSKPVVFRFRVYRQGVGELFDFTYTPKTQPPPSELSPRTVARLVRQELAKR